jgi:hypothetical protein
MLVLLPTGNLYSWKPPRYDFNIKCYENPPIGTTYILGGTDILTNIDMTTRYI